MKTPQKRGDIFDDFDHTLYRKGHWDEMAKGQEAMIENERRAIEHAARMEQIKGSTDEEYTTKKGSLIEFIQSGGKGILKILHYEPIVFDGVLRIKLIDFFYNSPTPKVWKNYSDIKKGVPNHKTVSIRKSIEKINERVIKETNQKMEGIIEDKTNGHRFNNPKIYRWRY